MIAFSDILIEPARKAGIKVPEDVKNFEIEDYKHFHLFCCAQLGQTIPNLTCYWDNAIVIARVPEEKIKTITFKELTEMGFISVEYSIP